MANVLDHLAGVWPAAVVIVSLALALWLADYLLLRRPDFKPESQLPRQLIMLLLTILAVVMAVLVLPISNETRGQLLGLLGLVLTAVVALSSTSFVANAMAGMMLRAVRSFRPGDFVRVGEHFGRVTERSLFHTELQTEDRDLTTLPNLYLATTPVTVVRASGTIISTTLSLGYDVPHGRVEELLRQAAEKAELEDPYVQVNELCDFSVTYRVAGFLAEVKQLISARSRLRAAVLDSLHGAGVEIVSPAYMNQRRLEPGARVLPEAEPPVAPGHEEPAPEEIIFDKAELAAAVEDLRKQQEAAQAEIAELEKKRDAAEGDARAALEREIAERASTVEALAARMEAAEAARAKGKEE